MSNKITLGLVGYGYWGPNLLRNLTAHPGAHVRWVSDLSPTNLQKAKAFLPNVQTTKSYDDLLADPELDAIVIATPTPHHFLMAKSALETGKHVLVEKPMTATIEEAKKLVDIVRKTRKVLCVDHPFVFSEPVKKMKELVKQKELGSLFYYDSLRMNMGLIQEHINVVVDLAPHDLSILDYLLDGQEPLYVSAVGSRHVGSTQAEVAHLHLVYPHGFTADITLSWLSPLKLRQILLSGDKAMVAFDDTEPSEKLRIYDRGVSIRRTKVTPFQPLYRSGDILIPKLPQTETLFSVISGFLDTIAGNHIAVNDVHAGYRVVQTIDRLQRSLQQSMKRGLHGA